MNTLVADAPAALDEVVLEVNQLVVEYPAAHGQVVHAVSDVTFDVRRGETLGLVGESGCGKSTVGKAITMLSPPTSGGVRFHGDEITQLPRRRLRETRRALQMIFQDPISSLNPRSKVWQIIAEGLEIWPEGRSRDQIREIVEELMSAVGLDPKLFANRRPHELSGGQCQRVSVARALVLNPDVIVCDEPVSALDVSVQAQILNLLEDLKERYSLTLVFIAHDLAVVKSISDRIAVMYLGKLCEIGPAEEVYSQRLHPYTQALIDAVPEPDPEVEPSTSRLAGELPSPLDPPSGCRFRTRCPLATARCAEEEPELRPMGDGHLVACHYA